MRLQLDMGRRGRFGLIKRIVWVWRVSVTISYAYNSINKKICNLKPTTISSNPFGQVQEGTYLESYIYLTVERATPN